MKIAICFYGYFGKINISRVGRNNQLNNTFIRWHNECYFLYSGN